MKFDSENYIDMKDGNYKLNAQINQYFEHIGVYVNFTNNICNIFDGGTTLASLKMILNFKNQQVVEKIIEICKAYRISKTGNVFHTECYEKDYVERLEDFIKAINLICEIKF